VRRDFVWPELDGHEEFCKTKDKEEAAVIAELQSARKELEDTNQLSRELKQRIFDMMPHLERGMVDGREERSGTSRCG